MQTSRFLESQTILRALEFAHAKGGFTDPQLKKTATTLIKRMRSTKSLSGRHQQLQELLSRGATIEEMMKLSGASRRTIFRYLNHFEQAGLNIRLERGQYSLVSQ